MPQTVILIRHAEKPGGDWPGPGLTEEGIEDPESLVVRGWQRAGGLALLLSGSSGALSRPDRIYASGVEKKDGTGSRSKRPLQTVAPLGRKLGLVIVDRFSKGQESDLASELMASVGSPWFRGNINPSRKSCATSSRFQPQRLRGRIRDLISSGLSDVCPDRIPGLFRRVANNCCRATFWCLSDPEVNPTQPFPRLRLRQGAGVDDRPG